MIREVVMPELTFNLENEADAGKKIGSFVKVKLRNLKRIKVVGSL